MAKGNNAIWEIWPTSGSDTNGGAYDATISGAGTDYSQQAFPQLSVSDLVGSGTTTLTSVSGGFTSAMIGNALYQDGDSDRYYIISVTSSNILDVDRATGTFVAANCYIGGALAGLNEYVSSRGGVYSNVAWVKNTGTMTITTSIIVNFGNTLVNVNPNCILGYNSTRGDTPVGAARPTITTSSAIVMLTLTDTNTLFANFNMITSGGSQASWAILGGGNRGTQIFNVQATGSFSIAAFSVAGTYIYCSVTGLTSSAAAAFYLQEGSLILCAGFGNACNVFSCAGTNVGDSGLFMDRVLAVNNTGAAIGFYMVDTLGNGVLKNCVAWNNGGDGLTDNSSYEALQILNSIFLKNGGYGLNYGLTPLITYPTVNYNAFGNDSSVNNTSGNRNNMKAGANDILLTADPFVNSGGTLNYLEDVLANFSLNNTAGGGATLRAIGFNPYIDIGALQHQDSGGGGGGTVGYASA